MAMFKLNIGDRLMYGKMHYIGVDDLWTRTIEEEPSLKELQELVKGYIEVVPISLGTTPAQLIVNEEGMIKDMPYNLLASSIAGCNIYGPAVILEGILLT